MLILISSPDAIGTLYVFIGFCSSLIAPFLVYTLSPLYGLLITVLSQLFPHLFSLLHDDCHARAGQCLLEEFPDDVHGVHLPGSAIRFEQRTLYAASSFPHPEYKFR